MANPLFTKSYLAILRGGDAAALTAAEALEALAQEQGMALQRTWAEVLAGWARGCLLDAAGGAAQLLHGLAALAEHGQRLDAPFYSALLAQLEAETLGAERALARIDEALALAQQIEQRCNLVFMHRLRGEILLKRDPADLASAEAAFQTAIATAKEQGAQPTSSGVAVARQALPIDQSPGRSPHHPRARPPRLRADAGNAGDRGSAGAVAYYRGWRACEVRINTAVGWLSC
jgi:predicted ATPase